MEHHFDFESSVMQNQSLKWDLGVGLCGEEACGWGSCLGLIKPHATHKSMAKLIMMIGKRTKTFLHSAPGGVECWPEKFCRVLTAGANWEAQALLSKRISYNDDAADGPGLSALFKRFLNLILLDTESDFWYQAKGQSGFFLQRVVTTFGMEFKVGKNWGCITHIPDARLVLTRTAFSTFFHLDG